MAKKHTMGSSANAIGMDMDWQAEDDLRSIMRANEIKEDPKRLAAVKALAKEKLVDMAKISVISGEKPESGDKD